MNPPLSPSESTIHKDLVAGVVVFFVALPLCLGVALASGAPLISGLIAGITGGIVVGLISGSSTSVSGPAAGLTVVVMAQIAAVGSFEAFLVAVCLAGVIQIGLGVIRAGFLADFIPFSVIKGLLAAIGVLLILKQFPHLVGYDKDPEGEMSFEQPDHHNTFSELYFAVMEPTPSAVIIGLGSIAILVLWDQIKVLKKSPIPSALVVVLFGVSMAMFFRNVVGLLANVGVKSYFPESGLDLTELSRGGFWDLKPEDHDVQMPVAGSLWDLGRLLTFPRFSELANPAVYLAALVIAAVASLETLLNLEAVDKLDPQQRVSPPSQELIAQGCGNLVSGLLGGIPVTSVIVRSSVNLNAGAQTKLSAIFHGILLLVSVAFFAVYLNMIPLACLAAILIVTGVKLVSPKLIAQMWSDGVYQFVPFVCTVLAIVFTDLLIGVVIGLGISASFILYSNLRRPIRRFVEKHHGGEVLHIQLANQVSFLNRAALLKVLDEVPAGGHVLLDAQGTDYIDPDILALIRDYTEESAPARGVKVSLTGFRSQYQLEDRVQYVDYSTRELQSQATPEQVLQILKEGHERFRTGQRLTRDLGRQVQATSAGQHPLAVVLSCIDSRAPVELLFDLGLGDVFSIRVAGNITSREVLGSMEYAVAVASAKLILVLGHTRCGAVTAAVNLANSPQSVQEATGCQHLESILSVIQNSVDQNKVAALAHVSAEEKQATVDAVARVNVIHMAEQILRQSQVLARLQREGKVAIVGGMYDVTTGVIEFIPVGVQWA